MKSFRTLFVAMVAGLMIVLGLSSASIADYPEKPIKIIVPYSPGGTTDVLVRLTAKYLEEAIGQTIIVVNIKGAGGAVGMLEAARAKPDGYTIGIYLTNTEVAMATGVAAFSPEDIVPTALMGDLYLTITGKGDTPLATLGDLKKAASEKPGEIGIAMGQGTLAHFAAVQLEDAIGEDLHLVNVGGGAQKKAAVLGGHVDTLMEPTPGVLAQHNAGELKIISVLAPERLPFLPDVPTAREQGFDVVSIQTMGLFVPKGTPEDRIEKISVALEKLGAIEAYQKRLKEINLIWNYKSTEELAEYVDDLRATIQKTEKIIRETQAKN